MSITEQLTPELSEKLQANCTTTLARIVGANISTVYATEAPLLSAFRDGMTSTATADGPRDAVRLLQTFTSSVPLSSYADYQSYTSRFFETPCLASRIDNLLAPGLPAFLGQSTGTTGGSVKVIPKYATKDAIPLPVNKVAPGTTVCSVTSFRYSKVIEAIDDRTPGENKKITLPMCLVSNGSLRIHYGVGFHDEEALMTKRLPSHNTSPHAVSLIHQYRTYILMHGLFAIVDPYVGIVSVPFSTALSDLISLLEEEWETLVQAVESGIIPQLDGLEDFRSYLQEVLTANPARATELRAIKVGSEGWLKKVWPKLTIVRSVISGPFACTLPKLHHSFGPEVDVRNVIYGTTESFAAYTMDYEDTEVLKMWDVEYFEYRDVERADHESELCQAWELKTGKQYELIATTREGLWRYRIGDVLEIVGFDTNDGQPMVKFVQRGNVVLPMSSVLLREQELRETIYGMRETLGNVTEFVTIHDDRKAVPHSVGFLVELAKGTDHTFSPNTLSALHTLLINTNESYSAGAAAGKIGTPTIRVLAPGTFSDYRGWQVQIKGGGSGQIKVPNILLEETRIAWFLERVITEIH